MIGGWLIGLAPTFVFYGPIVVLVATGLQRLVAHARGQLVPRFMADPFGQENRPYLVQLVLRTALAALVVPSAVLAIPRFAISDTEFVLTLGLVAVPALIFGLMQVVPARSASTSLNLVAAIATAFLAFQLVQVHVRSGLGDAVSIAVPFEDGEWTVGSGGRSTLISHHYGPMTPQQRYAIDFVVVRDGRTYEGDKTDPASYHIWDEPLVAPAAGIVVDVENDLRDWPIGGSESDRENARGNHVMLDIGEGRYLMFAHLRQGSATVAVGDRVVAGEVIGRVGNSGNTSEPHLHVQVQDSPDFPTGLFDTSVKTFPIQLTNITHVRGGTDHPIQEGLLRRNDSIRVVD
ncbi:MAG: M23 family metallopeptidase [Acidimicrobiia bacterium]|nr:M23 family metallopeptidase [Acidimicrobiia bacterium]